jgi:hypothetical protein
MPRFTGLHSVYACFVRASERLKNSVRHPGESTRPSPAPATTAPLGVPRLSTNESGSSSTRGTTRTASVTSTSSAPDPDLRVSQHPSTERRASCTCGPLHWPHARRHHRPALVSFPQRPPQPTIHGANPPRAARARGGGGGQTRRATAGSGSSSGTSPSSTAPATRSS